MTNEQTTLIERLRELEAAELDVASSVDMPAEHTANWQYAQTAREAREEIERLRAHEPRAGDDARVLRNLLREYCAITKLEPWSADWQCEVVVRDAVKQLGLQYGDKL